MLHEALKAKTHSKWYHGTIIAITASSREIEVCL